MYVIALPYLPRRANVAVSHHTHSDNVLPAFLHLLELVPVMNASLLLPHFASDSEAETVRPHPTF
jgi:hypothetical protein